MTFLALTQRRFWTLFTTFGVMGVPNQVRGSLSVVGKDLVALKNYVHVRESQECLDHISIST